MFICLHFNKLCVSFFSNELKTHSQATVVTNIIIKDNQLFEVELVEMIEKWFVSLTIGFTTQAPDRIEFLRDMTYVTIVAHG